MSTDQYNRKLVEGKKVANIIKKDLQTRQEQQRNGVPNFTLDAEIKGSFGQLDEIVQKVSKILDNFRTNQKNFGFTNKQLQKRQQQYEKLANQRTNLKREYDSMFQKKTTQDLLGQNPVPGYKPEYNQMNSKQLMDQKKKLDEQQQQHLDDLIGIVKNTKQGNKAIKQELIEQDQIIDELDKGFDQNIENMGRVRRNMTKLLQSSSNFCLIIAILIQIAGILCILLLWK